MVQTIDEILNGSDEGTEQVVDQQVDDDEGQGGGQSTGADDTQVAAEGDDQTDAAQPDEVRAELKALAKERERIRQKEAALDAERAKLQEQQTAGGEGKGSTQQPAELKELRKQYREALAASMIDPDDVEAAQKVEELEDQLESARIALAAQAQKTVSVQEQAAAAFNEVFTAVHAEFPFLDPEHPQADAGLNADINAFYDGLLKRGESQAVALRKAVDTFAPAQAKKLGLTTTKQPTTQKPATQAAAGVAREKLKGGFSEVRSAGGSSNRSSQPYTGPTPMEDILGRPST